MDIKDIRIGVVGGGVVGGATARAYAGFVKEVRVHDRVPERATATMREVLECDLVLVCLPTPQKEGSLECDVSCVDDFLGSLRHCGGKEDSNLVLKSTVPIGYTREARRRHSLPNLVHSPEFLTARTAAFDASLPLRNIIGGPWDQDNKCCQGLRVVGLLLDLYRQRWPHVPVTEMSSDESEAVKLIQNSFSAVKIAFLNECRLLTDKLGLDWQTILNAVLAGGWVSPMHTQVPGRDGKRGFGGACLVKDLANLISCYADARFPTLTGSYPQVMMGAHLRNQTDRNR